MDTAVVLGDTHFPHHDPAAVGLALDIVREIQPGTVYLNGDIIDMHQISRWGCAPKHKLTLQADIDQTREFLRTLRDAAPAARVVFLEGNHEARLGKYLMERPEIHGLACLQLPALLGFEELGIQFERTYDKWWGWVVTHGDRVSSKAGATAQKMIDVYGSSGLNNHVHRLAQVTRRQAFWARTWIENGCLCSLTPDYTTVADWEQGFTILHREDNGAVWPEMIAIRDGAALFRGEVVVWVS